MGNPVRLRLAPSPTGDVHIGTIWIALFNRLYAHQHNGSFILRIEDTDQKRQVSGSVEKIYAALDWYGLTPDEGPVQNGPYGPYVQSQRLHLYQKYAVQLIEQGSAYYCFCSPERLEQLRAGQQALKRPPRYDKLCAALSLDQSRQRVTAGEPHVIRMNLPNTGTTSFKDLIRSDVTFRNDQIDDSVILKSDGFPTYHLAVVVDDHLMEISHVFRAEEWLPSTPKHLFLYDRLGWKPPSFAHFPQILGSDKKKLSKRQGASSALSFRDQGYLPEAMRNFLVLMGWHPKGDDEVLTDADVLAQFRLEDMNPSGAVFDHTKLDWLNGRYIRQMQVPELVRRLEGFWKMASEYQLGSTWRARAVSIVRDRMKTLVEIDEATGWLIPQVWDIEFTKARGEILLPKKGNQETVLVNLKWAKEWLASQPGEWEAADVKSHMIDAIAKAGKKNIDVLWPLRVAISLRSASPDVFDILAFLKQTESLRRIDKWTERTLTS